MIINSAVVKVGEAYSYSYHFTQDHLGHNKCEECGFFFRDWDIQGLFIPHALNHLRREEYPRMHDRQQRHEDSSMITDEELKVAQFVFRKLGYDVPANRLSEILSEREEARKPKLLKDLETVVKYAYGGVSPQVEDAADRLAKQFGLEVK